MTPDIFAYCGYAFFPTMILTQIVNLFEVGLVAGQYLPFTQRFDALRGHITKVFRTYPRPDESVTIIHAGRDCSKMNSIFRVGVLTSAGNNKPWLTKTVDVPPTRSGLILEYGSGTTAIRRAVSNWPTSTTAPTSRDAFKAFASAIRSGNDPHSGGPPQMVGLYRMGNGRQFGMIWNGAGYLSGMPVGRQAAEVPDIEWRNTAFERCSVVTRRRLPGAQRH